jgi:hypothetical protein
LPVALPLDSKDSTFKVMGAVVHIQVKLSNATLAKAVVASPTDLFDQAINLSSLAMI